MPASKGLASSFPDLTSSINILNGFFNMLAYNVNGREAPDTPERQEGFLFWLAWVTHQTANLVNIDDANGPLRPVFLTGTCQTLISLINDNPQLEFLMGLSALLADQCDSPELGLPASRQGVQAPGGREPRQAQARRSAQGGERMNKRGPGVASILTMVGFAFSCFGLLLFLWLSFGGPIPLAPKGYRFQVSFPEATTLAEQADVRIAGVSVGKVSGKVRDPKGNRTLATIELDRKYAPIARDARAVLRQKTLLGETYVQLNVGTKNGVRLPEGGRLADGRVEETVEFDEFLDLFPESTREDFRRWQQTSAEVIDGRGRDLNDALGNLGTFAQDGSELLKVLNRRKGSLRALVRETGTVFEALTQDEDALRAFLADTSSWFQATAIERENLAQSIRIFPTFLDESKATLARLEKFSIDTDPLLADLRPVARDLTPTLRDLRRMAPDLRRFFGDLPALIDASKVGLPALGDVLTALRPSLGATGNFLAQLNPVLQWLEINQGATTDFISIGGAATAGKRATQNPNGNGHVLPQLITTGSQSLITPTRTGDNRGNSYLEHGWGTFDRYKEGFYILPTWDCANAGGEKKPDATPGCYVQGPIEYQGTNLRFPHLVEDMPGR